MTLHSSGLFPAGPRQAASTMHEASSGSPSLADEKTLALGATIHFVRPS